MADELTDEQAAALETEPDDDSSENAEQTNAIASVDMSNLIPTTRAEIWKGYQSKIIKLENSGYVVQIDSLDPGDYETIFESPYHALMTVAGIKEFNRKELVEFINNLTPRQRAVVTEAEMMNVRRVVIKAVKSLFLTMKTPSECSPNETSIFQIGDRDCRQIYNEVDKLSGWSADADRFQRVMEDDTNAEG